jgi:class 3 adenylate cyclase/tetratricopeptide (TPR) repeat protein
MVRRSGPPARPRRTPPSRVGELPQGVVTFLLTDIEGSSPLWEAHGVAMGAALARHEELVAETVASHHGRLVKGRGEGDSTLSVFARATDAVQAALALQLALGAEVWPGGIALPTRAALHTGEAELRGGDYYGPTLNRAARLRSLTQGGQILLSRATAELVADQLPAAATLIDAGIHQLKGLSRAEQVVGLAHPNLGPPPALDVPTERAVASAFVGREVELGRLSAALGDALQGQGRLVLVAGEAGIGKTRLAEELAGQARSRGVRVLWGRCHEEEGTPGYWPWTQILRSYASSRAPAALASELGESAAELAQLVPEVAKAVPGLGPPPAVEPRLARFRLFDAANGFLHAASRGNGLVLILDDLHWADPGSLLLLQFVARELTGARLLVVGTYRDVEVNRRHPLNDTLAELVRQPATARLALSGLNEAEVASCVVAIAGAKPAADLAAVLHQQTEGNPFFVGEVVRLLATEDRLDVAGLLSAGVPQGVQEVLGRRLNRLSVGANQVLAVASVQGREFELDVVGQAANLSAEEVLDAVEEAIDAHLVVEADRRLGDRYRFTHALVRQTLYDELSITRRKLLHRRVGEALAELRVGELELHLAELAHHFFQAAGPHAAAPALDYAIRAGRRALALLAYEEAIHHYQQALQALQLEAPDDLQRQCELLLALGESWRRAGGRRPARETLLQAADLARQLGDARRLALAVLTMGGFRGGLWITGFGAVDRDLVALLEEALGALDTTDSDLRARLLAFLAGELYWANQRAHMEALSLEAVEMARRLGEPKTLAYTLTVRRYVLWTPDQMQQQIAAAQELGRLAGATGDPEIWFATHYFRATDLASLGDLAAAASEVDALFRLAQRLKQPFYLWVATCMRAMLAQAAGRLEEAEALAGEALEHGRQGQERDAVLTFGTQLAQIRIEQGRPREVLASARASAEHAPGIPLWRCCLALLYAQMGDTQAARDEFEGLAAMDFADLPRDYVWLISLCMLAEVCAVLDDQRRAVSLYQLLLPFAARNLISSAGIVSLGPVSHYLGVLATVMRRWDQAVEHLEESLLWSGRQGAMVSAARSRVACARALLERARPGDLVKAQGLLNEAYTTAEELGLAGITTMCRRLQEAHKWNP